MFAWLKSLNENYTLSNLDYQALLPFASVVKVRAVELQKGKKKENSQAQ